MAGTPTTNYKFPTYAETDVPDLAGAYNQAVNAIDAKIKEVADTIPSDVDVPDATSTTKGIAKLYDSTSIGDSTQEDGGVTPAALKAAVDGVAANVSGKQNKLTPMAPISITGDTIGVGGAIPQEDGTVSNSGVVTVTGKQEDIASATSLSAAPVPNAKAVKDYVDAKIPMEQQAYTGTAPITVNAADKTISVADATTSAKGVVQLTDLLKITEKNMALTGESLVFGGGKYNEASRALTVADLSRLKVNRPTGLVYLESPSS